MSEENRRFPLSLSQQNIWALEQRYSGTSIDVISATIRISGRVDFAMLAKALNLIIQADSSLRTRLVRCGGEIMQEYAPYSEEHFPVLDFSLTDPDGFAYWETAMTREPMRLFDGPLCCFYPFRTGEAAGGVLVKSHHIIFDGWSQVLLCNRIAQTYLSLISGKAPVLEPSPGYDIHVAQEREYLESRSCVRDEDYWRSMLETPAEAAAFKEQRGASISPVGRRRSYKLPEILNHAIAEFCREHRVSPFAPYYMALAIAARRMGGGRRLTVGVPIHNRTDLISRQTTGMFVSTLPLITELDESWTTEQFNDSLSENWLELLRHQRFPFERIEALPRESGGRLFHVALSYQDNLQYKDENATVHFSGRWNYSGYQAEQLCIHVTNLEDHRRYTVDYDYLAQLFTDDEIDRLHSVVCSILDQILSHPDRPISEVCILSAAEREQVLYSFNRTAMTLPDTDPWESFSAVVRDAPRRVAVIDGGRRVTYEELYRRALMVGAAVTSRRGGEELVAAVLLPRGAELTAAMLGILAAGGGWLMLSPTLPKGRAAEIISSSGAQVLITTEKVMAGCGYDSLPAPLLLMETLDSDAAGDFIPPAKSEDDLAYVVYTSGSTGVPKGVEISRGNLMNFAAGMKGIFPCGAMLSLTNVSFDAFVLECPVSLINGLTVVFAGDDQQENPAALAALMTGYGVDYLCLTPSRLGAYLEYPAFREAVSGRKGVLCGGEAFSGELLSKIKELTGAHIYNQYGPSETTVGVSVARLDHCASISVGKPMPNCAIYILDDRLSPLPVGVYGEIYIGGKNVGRGYRAAPELTKASFMADPFISGGRMYRSGDVACWTAAGELRLRGRTDRQIKLRGQRVEPDELKFCLERHPKVKKAAVRAVEQFGQTELCAYYTSDADVQESELMHFLADALPVYLLPVRIIKLESMPMTAGGKINERELPAPELSRGDSAPETDRQKKILDVFRQVLERPEMGADGDYFQFGGNSLNAMETAGLLEPILSRRLKISDLYACRTAKRLDEWLDGGQGSRGDYIPLKRAEERGEYPVSDIQENIYVQCRMAPHAMAYHMPGAFRLSGDIDREKLENAFRALIDSDDIYRTAFVLEKGALKAKILPHADFELPEISGGSLEELWDKCVRPFDLARPPFIRAALWNNGEERILFMDVHHIVGDGVSTPLMMKRLDEFYRGGDAKPPRLTYRDYCVFRSKTDYSGDVAAWAAHLSPLPAALELPGDLPKPRPFDFKGGLYSFELPAETGKACDRLCRERELTSFMLFISAYALLLSRVSGHEELTVGTPVSGRSRSELWEICGPFLSTLPMKLSARGGETVGEFLDGVKNETLWMLDHQELPLDKVLTALDLPREPGENPLYQVMFTYRPLDVESLTLAGSSVEIVDTPHTTAKAEFNLEAASTGGKYCFTLEYASSIFERSTVEFYARSFMTALAAIAGAGPDTLLGDVEILPAGDRLRLLDIPRQTVSPFRSVSIDVLVAEKTALTPDAPAVIYHGKTVTFAQLEARACAIAGQLQRAGAVSGDRIGLCCRRTPELFAAMLAILKNGCAYVPFLPEFPQKRVEYMLSDAEASMVLCDRECESAAKSGGVRSLVMTQEEAPFTPPKTAGKLMYILFTSGSTGRPKGVMVSRRAAANYIVSMGEILSRDDGPIMCVTNMTFDIFLAEGLLPLSMGRTVVLADEDERTLPWRMAQCITDGNVTTMQITPSQLQMCLGSGEFREAVKNIRLLLLAGEASNTHIVSETAKATHADMVDVYGPTEATVYVSSSVLKPGKPVTIGTPFKNCRMYVLDADRKDVFPTSIGELYLAGECLAEGYVGRPELTEAAFVPDPLFPDEKMYRTGDIARLKADGEIDCLGRADAQIKLNGLRVELDEINGAAIDSGLVSQCVTVQVAKSDGSTYLRAFVTAKDGKTYGEHKLQTHMRTLLPDYMIPAEIVVLKALPSNASGKVDMRALKDWKAAHNKPAEAKSAAPDKTVMCETVPAPSLVRDEQPAEKTPEPSVEKALEPEVKAMPVSAAASRMADIWRDTLDRQDISETESFFRQGGTSLAALDVLTKYYEAGISMTLAEFYDHPTLAGQAEMAGEPAGAGPAAPPAENAASEPFVPRPAPSAPPAGPSLPAKCVLITGATGYLGAHILYELIENDLAGQALCLMRDDDRQRLIGVLSGYFGADWTEKNNSRIAVSLGDITKKNLGLEAGEYQALCRSADAVFHTAADVRHYASDSRAWMTNVYGTAHAAQLALDAGAPFNHISTLSVSGEYLVRDKSLEAVFTEDDFYIGQNWHDNIYVEGKFLAEQEIYDRMQAGLNARIYRLGRLVGRDRDGVFQRNPRSNAVYLTLRGIQAAGAVPESMAGVPMDLTPVDYCAKAIVALSNGSMPVCHVADPTPVTMLEAARAIDPDIKVMSDMEFSAALAKLIGDDREGLLAPLVEVWNRGMHDGPAKITQNWDKTTAMLAKLGVAPPSSPPEKRLRAYTMKKITGCESK